MAHDFETFANTHDSGSTHCTESTDDGCVEADTISIVFNRFVVDPTTEDACTCAEGTMGTIVVITNSAPEFERDKDTTSEEVKSEPGPTQNNLEPTTTAHPTLDVYSGSCVSILTCICER